MWTASPFLGSASLCAPRGGLSGALVMTGAGEQPRAHGDYSRAQPAGARRSLSVDGSAGVPRLTCSVQQAQIIRPAPR